MSFDPILAWFLIKAIIPLEKCFLFKGQYEVLVKLLGSGERMPGLELISIALVDSKVLGKLF